MSALVKMTSPRSRLITLFGAVCTISTAGCASSATTEKEEGGGEATKGDKLITKYESSFDPSKYDPAVAAIEALAKSDTAATGVSVKPLETSPPETVPGFRIQILATTEIDEANALRTEISNLPRIDSVYVSYDSPYYKVRVGDFRSRPDANLLLKLLIESGYKDAWIVADRVFKNPFLKKSAPGTSK